MAKKNYLKTTTFIFKHIFDIVVELLDLGVSGVEVMGFSSLIHKKNTICQIPNVCKYI